MKIPENFMEDALKKVLEEYGLTEDMSLKDCVEKQIAKKPTYIGKKFRNHGKHLSNGQSIDSCYECPSCKSNIFHIFDDENYCEHCGQRLDWS